MLLKDPPFAVPDPPPKAPPGLENFGDLVISGAKYLGILAVVVGLIICAIMMALGRRQRSETAANGALGLPWVFGAGLLISGAVGIVTTLMLGKW